MALTKGDAAAIASTAQRLGVDPRTLGALFELESGTDPNIWGGAGGQYRGLIQFGPGARKEVGLPQGPMTISGQLPYVEKYFQQRGFQPGKHGPTELYRTVLVGNPGQSGTDSFGTNSDAAAKRMLPGGDLYQQFSRKFDPVIGGSAGVSPSPAQLTQESDSLGLSSSGGAGTGERRPGDPLAAVAAALVQSSLEAAQAQPREPGRMAALSATPGLEAQIAAVTALLPGAAPTARAAAPASPQSALPSTGSQGGDLGGELDIVSLGKQLQAMGLKVAENPAFGGVGKHSPNSHHYAGNAVDLTIQPGSPLLKGRADSDWRSLTQQIGAKLKSALPGAEIFHPGDDPVGGHDSHIHLALPGGRTKITPALAQLLSM